MFDVGVTAYQLFRELLMYNAAGYSCACVTGVESVAYLHLSRDL